MSVRSLLPVALGVALMLVGCGNAGTPSTTSALLGAEATSAALEMRGVLTLTVESSRSIRQADYQQCWGLAGYDDITGGVSVTVYNADGRIVGLGKLEPGKKGGSAYECSFMFTVTDLPAGQGPYQYEVSHRGRLTVAEETIRDGLVRSSLG